MVQGSLAIFLSGQINTLKASRRWLGDLFWPGRWLRVLYC